MLQNVCMFIIICSSSCEAFGVLPSSSYLWAEHMLTWLCVNDKRHLKMRHTCVLQLLLNLVRAMFVYI